MKKKIIFILIFLFALVSLNAQIACDPNDEIYSYISLWEEKGIITGLPLLRPYPIQVLKKILNDVVQYGNTCESQIAQNYLDRLDEKVSFDIGEYTEMRTDFNDLYLQTGIGADITGSFSPSVTVSAKLGLYLLSDSPGSLMPRWTSQDGDYLSDWASFRIGDRNVQFSQSLVSGAALGNDRVFFNAGFMRTSFGPFFDTGSIISPEVPHSGHFSFVYWGKKVTISSVLLALVASDSLGDGAWPNKYLSLHSISFFPGPAVEFGFLESVIYGDRFDPMYLLPFSMFYYNQVFSGVHDNSMAGLFGRFKLPQSVNINTTLYIDDIHFNDVVRFNFKTKFKLALQTGVSWTPLYRHFRKVAFEYLMVTPYMYSHRGSGNDDEPNFVNYTHKGQNLGCSLEPNSDRFLLQAAFAFEPVATINAFTSLVRHGNASDGITDGDGTIFDDGYDDEGNATFQDETRFLSQDILEYTFQFGFDSLFEYPLKKINFKWGLGYTFEAVFNKDLVEDQNEIRNLLKVSFGISY
jgi:hypothetical protein